jgi:ectoine hydroxylase-related dioxygenase (phytanoyl-CoA dioxygenase family)
VTDLETTLPTLDDHTALPQAAIDAFRRDGHVLVPGLANEAEVGAFRPIIEQAALKHSEETRPLEERDTYGKAFLQVPNLWVVDESVRRFVLAKRFASVAAQLMGVTGVRLYHDQALFKEGGGGRTPWHQDQYYWPLDTENTITMWMPLVDVTADMGGSMTFVSGSHRLGYLGEYEISDESDSAFERMLAERGLPAETHGPVRAGDATFHSGWTLHAAGENPTSTLRSVMTVIYFADGARVTEPDHKWRENDLRRWLPGLSPGDAAASHLNPLLYTADV